MPKTRCNLGLSRAQELAILALSRYNSTDRLHECSEIRLATWESLERRKLVKRLPGYFALWRLTESGALVGKELLALERQRIMKPESRWADAARRFLQARNRKGISRLTALQTCADLLTRLRSGSRRRRYKQLRGQLRELQDRLTRRA